MAEAYLAQRQRLEYPWLDEAAQAGSQAGAAAASQPAMTAGGPMPVLLEIGAEELPAGDLDAALEQLRKRVPALLDELRLEHGAMRCPGHAAPPGGLC